MACNRDVCKITWRLGAGVDKLAGIVIGADEMTRVEYSDAEQRFEHRKDLERLEALRPIDDDFMRCLFRGQPELAQEVLRTVTGIADLVVTHTETQRDIKRLAGARSVCLDVWAKDSAGREYDFEVQRADSGADAHRARYHSSVMDVESLSSSEDFRALPESYVIFLTECDEFGAEMGVYRFVRVDMALGIPFGDGSHILYVNARYNGDDPLGDLMHDFLCSDPDDMRVSSLAERVRYLKRDPEGVSYMCKMMEEMRYEALQKGLQRGALSTLASLVRDGIISVQDAAARMGVDADRFARMVSEEGLSLAR